jgi:hypothetical protein
VAVFVCAEKALLHVNQRIDEHLRIGDPRIQRRQSLAPALLSTIAVFSLLSSSDMRHDGMRARLHDVE